MGTSSAPIDNVGGGQSVSIGMEGCFLYIAVAPQETIIFNCQYGTKSSLVLNELLQQ